MEFLQASDISLDRPLFVFVNRRVNTSSWATILADLEEHPHWSYVAYQRDDEGQLTALSYRWDDHANDYATSENWDITLQELQQDHCFRLRDHPHTNRLREHVEMHNKLWVDQHCIPRIDGRMGCMKRSAVLFQGLVTAALLTKEKVDRAFDTGRAHDLLGFLENWLGRGWVQQEVTACGKLVNLDAFEHFFERGAASGDGRLRSGGESLCLLLRRMKGAAEEPFADRIVRFYAVNEADFTVEDDRAINIPDFSDVGYEAFPIGQAPPGYVIQPEIQVQGDRVYMRDSNGGTIGKWFKRLALYKRQ